MSAEADSVGKDPEKDSNDKVQTAKEEEDIADPGSTNQNQNIPTDSIHELADDNQPDVTEFDQTGNDVIELSDIPVPPDGGWGWIVVFGSFMIHVIADGIVYSFGVFLPEFISFFDEKRADVSLLGSLLPGITLLSGPIASALTNKYGCRKVTIAGACVAATGFLLSIFATNLIFLYFTFGILAGFGFGLMYLPAIVTVGYYFEKKRAFATGIAVCGSGFGTFIMAPITTIAIQEYGWKGAVLIQTGLILNCAACGALFRPLESPRHQEMKRSRIKAKLSHAKLETQKKSLNGTAPSSVPLLHKENGSDHKEDDNNEDNTKSGRKKRIKSPSITVTSSHGSINVLQEARFTEEDLTKAIGTKIKSSLSADHALSRRRVATASGSQHSLQGPMSRKDIFYSASLINIPMYKSNHSLYVTSVTSIPDLTAKPSADWLICRCFSVEMRTTFNEMMDLSLLKDIVFLVFVISNIFTSIGFNTPFIFLPDRAEQEGIGKFEASFLLSIVGIANTMGRVLFGFMADMKCINRLYLYNGTLTICGIATALTGWLNTYPLLVIYACVFGVFIGSYVALTSVILVDLLGLEKLTNSFGLLLMFQGVATLVGPPFAGGMFDETGSYKVSFGITGSLIALSGAMLFIIPCLQRYVQHKQGITKREVELGRQIKSSDIQLDDITSDI